MRRAFLLGVAVAAGLMLPAAHMALAAPAAKANICHLNSSNTPATDVGSYSYSEHYYGYDYSYSYGWNYTYSFGNVISVAESAVASHEAHGDSRYYGNLDQWVIDYLSSWSQYSYSYSYSWDYTPYGYDYYGSYSYSETLTNAAIKNADCYVASYSYN